MGCGTRFIELAGEINTAMPQWVVDRLAEALDGRFRKGLNGTRILVVGLAYKKNVDDMRESPALVIMDLLNERGAAVAYHDPYCPVIPPTREHRHLAGQRSVPLDPSTLAGFPGGGDRDRPRRRRLRRAGRQRPPGRRHAQRHPARRCRPSGGSSWPEGSSPRCRTPSAPLVAVAGCGYWGRNLVRSFAELGALAAVIGAQSDRTAESGAVQRNESRIGRGA